MKARWLEAGDQITLDNGRSAKIKTVSKGIMPRHLHIEFTNGDWSEIEFDTVVEEKSRKKT